MVNPTKRFYESKTFWINALAIVGGVITALSVDLQTGGAITLSGIINMVLRSITTHNITM